MKNIRRSNIEGWYCISEFERKDAWYYISVLAEDDSSVSEDDEDQYCYLNDQSVSYIGELASSLLHQLY